MNDVDMQFDNPDFRAVALAAKFCGAWGGVGGTRADLNSLAENPQLLAKVIMLARHQAEVGSIKHVVECGKQPLLRRGWKVKTHLTLFGSGGAIELFAENGKLYAWFCSLKYEITPQRSVLESEHQVSVADFLERLRRQIGVYVLNANVLDHLLMFKELIPRDWCQGISRIFFIGTSYEFTDGEFMRGLQKHSHEFTEEKRVFSQGAMLGAFDYVIVMKRCA